MTQLPEQFMSRLKDATLTASEREAMRARLAAFTRMHTGNSPWAFVLRHAIVSSLVVVGALGISTVALAQHALPGDFLYSVKTNITDPAAVALTFDEDDKISVQLDQIGGNITDEGMLADRDDVTMTAALVDSPVTAHDSAPDDSEHRDAAAASIFHQDDQRFDRRGRDGKLPTPSARISPSLTPSTASLSATPALRQRTNNREHERGDDGRDD